MSTFSVFDAVMIGAFGMATMILVVACVVVSVWKVWPVITTLAKAMEQTAKQTESIPKVLEGINRELAYMRQMSTPQGMNEPVAGQEMPSQGEAPPPYIPFPSAPEGLYKIVPDADPDDTDMNGLIQSDADLAEIEKIEALRQAGIHVEDDDVVHEGVVRESE